MGASYSVLAAAPEQRAAAIGDIAATEFEDLTSAIVENTEASRVVKGMLQVLNNTHPGVLEDINLQLGFVRGEVNASTKTAPLPPELQEFQVLAERSSVEVVLKDEKFTAAFLKDISLSTILFLKVSIIFFVSPSIIGSTLGVNKMCLTSTSCPRILSTLSICHPKSDSKGSEISPS